MRKEKPSIESYVLVALILISGAILGITVGMLLVKMWSIVFGWQL